LLPHNQQMRHLRAEASGEECSKTFTSGEYVKMPMTIVSYHPEKKPDLRTREEKSEDLKNRKKMEKNFKKWKIIEKPGICIINDSAIAKVSIEKKNEKRNNG